MKYEVFEQLKSVASSHPELIKTITEQELHTLSFNIRKELEYGNVITWSSSSLHHRN